MHQTHCSRSWDNININIQRWQYRVCCLTPWRGIAEKYWNAPEIIQRRRALLAGERHVDCQKCWKAEATGRASDRMIWGQDREPTTAEDAFASGNQLVINLGNTCDMACRYCNAEASSIWAKRLGIANDATGMSAERVSHLRTWIVDNRHRFDRLRISGGEPSVNGSLYDLISWLQPRDTDIAIETNLNCTGAWLTRFQRLIDELIGDGNRVEIRYSIDATGLRQEYQRQGSDWTRQSDSYLMLGSKDVRFELALTMTPLTLESMIDAIDWSINTAGQLSHRPRWSNASMVHGVLSADPWFGIYEDEIRACLTLLSQDHIDGAGLSMQMRSWLGQSSEPSTHQRSQLIALLDDMEERWGGAHWRQLYPKLSAHC